MKHNFDITTFTKHLSVMIGSGISINEALTSLSEQAGNKSVKTALQDILLQITKGNTLTKAFSLHPKYFNAYYLSLIQIGEESGTLEENLKYLSIQLAKDTATKKKFSSAMLYPSFVLFFAFVIGGGISIFILPKLVDFFNGFEIELPLATRILLGFAGFMKDFGVLVFIGIALSIIILYFVSKISAIKQMLDSLTIRLPAIGRIFVTYQTTRMCRNLGTLLKSGVSIARSLEVTADSLSNSEFSNALKEISKDIEKGSELTVSMKKQKIFPDFVNKMIGVGEKSGNLEESLIYIADFYDEELDDLTKNLGNIIEPVLLVIVGIVVGFIALAIISPIYELTGSIGVK